ncbi:hypothetical protein [Microbacterium saperdae]|uniref:Dioxygenase n=1 Tax=Microbacterium saperdae TaxID=69368 RepID=A0A543BMK6_9MICO|nr:hypothetical protein [Microbacterium saperdae]TQL86080.1 hypothetical protein FB560_1722 [Microbacterium saperdae]GGM50777.1 hypothetical protein GCM10010489_22830 [Microbacterium saperdae]
MAARGSKSAQERTQAERARLHAARSDWHQGQIRRRIRDNTIAGIVGGLLVVAAIASQVVHAQVTVPEPSPTPTVEPSAPPAPSDSPTSEPTPSETPAE